MTAPLICAGDLTHAAILASAVGEALFHCVLALGTSVAWVALARLGLLGPHACGCPLAHT